MNQITLLLIFTTGLLACQHQPANQAPLTEAEQKAKLDRLSLDFQLPVLVDSSVYVMYPLTLQPREQREGGMSSGSYGYSSYSNATYWNIIFYNTSTGSYHLLDDQRKMVIHNYGAGNSMGRSSSASQEIITTGYNPVDKIICYAVTTTDFNADGKFDDKDPNYLFISDKAGHNFKQISPDSVDVTAWRPIRETQKILIQATIDSNKDKKFDDKDETVPMVYDLNSNELAKEVFSDAFKMKLKQQLDQQWLKMQQK